MGAKHTPGRNRNWTASTGSSGYGAHDGVTVTDNRGLVVAVAIGDVPELDALATARLIASAPDLLEACQTALAYCEHLQSSMFGVEPTHAAELRAAIAKATGEAS
jgi:hypothetical protein